MEKQKAKGYPGSWFADIGHERFPCVHDCYRTADGRYLDRFSGVGSEKWETFVEAIAFKKRVIVTDDGVLSAGPSFQRASKRLGYIGVFEVDQVEGDKDGLRFRMGKQLVDLTR